MASITLKHIYKAYPQTKEFKKKEQEEQHNIFAVHDFNLVINDGEFVVLVGPSGCGKSTTLRMIAGLEDISAGELYIGDVLANEVDASKRDIAMVFQNYALYPHMTTYQNMSYGLKLRKIEKPLTKNGKPVLTYDKELVKKLTEELKKSKDLQQKRELKLKIKEVKNIKNKQAYGLIHYSKEEIDEKVQNAAEILDIKHLLNRKPSDMSGGQRQRVALGRALVRNPKVFLLDEPLSNLDAKLRASMRNEIVKLHEKVKTTFVYVTHDQVEAMTMGDRIVVMKDGVIQQVDTPSNIYDNPVNMFVAGFIGTPQMNFFDVKMKAGPKDLNFTFENEESLKFNLKDFKTIEDKYINYDEYDVKLGIRGEHISISDKGLEAEITFVEVLGNTTNIICKLLNSEAEFNISIQERSTLKAGDKIFIKFEAKNIHLFDNETHVSIYKREDEQQ